MIRFLSLLLLLAAVAAPTAAVHAYDCSVTTDEEMAQCTKNASPLARKEIASRSAARQDDRPSLVKTPAWLDLRILELQIYGADKPENPQDGEPWLQALREFPDRNIMLLRSSLGPPTLIGISPAAAGRKPEVFVVARLPKDKFSNERCAMPGDTGQTETGSRDYSLSPPAGVRLLKQGTALAIPLAYREDLGNGFIRVEETQFVQVTRDGLVPLICIRNHALQSLTGHWGDDGLASTDVSGDDWTLIVTGHWHEGHADIRAVHAGTPARTLLFRWNESARQYRQVKGR
jgi:hypothetical protein